MKKLLLLPIISLIISCETEKQEEIGFDSIYEEKIFKKISDLNTVNDQYWSGYNSISELPLIIQFFTDVDDFNSTYIVNDPPSLPDGSVKLNVSTFGLNIYRNNAITDEIANMVEPLRSFASIELQGNQYFLMRQRDPRSTYDEFKNVDDNWIPTILNHELFHYFQFDIQQWGWSGQEYIEAEFTPELISHLLLLSEISVQAYSAPDSEYLNYLKLYCAIMQTLMEIDSNGFIRNSAQYSERIEGSARYVEHFTANATIYPTINFDPTHSWNEQLKSTSDGDIVNYIFQTRIWYHTGAIATHLLRSKGIDVENEYRAGKTPFQLTESLLNLTNQETVDALTEAKNSVNWYNIQQDAQSYFDLINE